jgi:hypothetical protein
MRKSVFFILIAFSGPAMASEPENVFGRSILLNGTWQIAEVNDRGSIPVSFVYHGQVPGLVDCSDADFEDPGLATGEPRYYWYKTAFQFSPHEGQAILKIHKAKYGARILVNGQLVADNLPNFTSSYFNISSLLKEEGQENELLIRVGTHNTLPDTVPYGKDGEKAYYVPGIYDDVELIRVHYPYLQNIQIAPDPMTNIIRVKAEVISDSGRDNFRVSYAVKEKAGNKSMAQGYFPPLTLLQGLNTLDFTIEVPEARSWSPETPFLYTLELNTKADSLTTVFGMRSFSFDPQRGMAVLNGVHRYLRGTNLAVLRFEEDSLRGHLLWNRKWVIQLHEAYKNEGMNTIRYTIGFPPDFWYDIADSLGLLIQDEYPIWTGLTSKEDSIRNSASVLTREFVAWMRERWNHPSVVIWDANNESAIASTGASITAVRHLDLSNRPWDNGWGEPVSIADPIESHPYFFIRFWDTYIRLNGAFEPSGKGIYYDLFSGNGDPLHPTNLWNTPYGSNQPWPNAVINNEYEWLWLMRDGTPTYLDTTFYQKYCPACNAEDRFLYYARALAAATEYWRCNRKCAAVMYFVGLTFSRKYHLPSSTCDNFVNPVTLEFEPNFAKYVLPAFQPIGLMIDRWEDRFVTREKLTVPVVVINDLLVNWQGEVTLSLYRDEQLVLQRRQPVNLPAMGNKSLTFMMRMPKESGAYRLEATTIYQGRTILSVRDFTAENTR